MSLDTALFLSINGSATSPQGLTALAIFATTYLPQLVAGCIVGVFFAGDRQVKHRVLIMLFAVAIAWLLARLGQHFLPIDRPFILGLGKQWLPHAASHSFPSKHASAAFGLATAVVLVAGQVRWKLCALCAALLIAWSRVYLGLHYPSDILAGALVGVVSGWLAYRLSFRHLLQPPAEKVLA